MKPSHQFHFWFLFATSFLLISCATSNELHVGRVTPGMEKSEVIELLGSPQRTTRSNNSDHWLYVFYVNDQKSGAEIRFEQGKVVQVRRSDSDKFLMEDLMNSTSMDSYQQKVLERRKSSEKLKDLE
jgi:outer membrane protein assembly factor BamE (lipoprotein component of BamABCDE complex)